MSEERKKNVIRNAIVAVIGLIIGGVIVSLIQMLGHSLFPIEDMDFSLGGSKEAIFESAMKNAPFGALLFIPLSHGIGTIVACFLVMKFSKNSKIPGLIIGILLLVATAYTLFSFYHPTWVIVLDIVLVVLGIFIPFAKIKKKKS